MCSPSVRSCYGKQPWTIHIFWFQTRDRPPSTEQCYEHTSCRYTKHTYNNVVSAFVIALYYIIIKLSGFLGTQCIPQRAALLKSMLNFLKKAIQDPAFSDGIRHGKSMAFSYFFHRSSRLRVFCQTCVYTCNRCKHEMLCISLCKC